MMKTLKPTVDDFIKDAKANKAERIPAQKKKPKAGEKVFFNLSLTKQLRQKVKLVATEKDLSMNDYIVQVLAKSVEKH